MHAVRVCNSGRSSLTRSLESVFGTHREQDLELQSRPIESLQVTRILENQQYQHASTDMQIVRMKEQQDERESDLHWERKEVIQMTKVDDQANVSGMDSSNHLDEVDEPGSQATRSRA